MYQENKDIIDLIDIQTLDKSSQWRSDDKVKATLKELVETKLKSKDPKEAFAAYECYHSWISQVKIAHQKIQKWEIAQAIYQYQGLMEGYDKVQNLLKGNIKEKVAKMIA